MQNKDNEQKVNGEIKDVKTPESNIASVPYIVYESEQARSERQNKRLVIALITAVAMLFISNFIWLYAWCQYDYANITVDSGESGNANFIGNDGDIHNGTNNSEYPNESAEQEEQVH